MRHAWASRVGMVTLVGVMVLSAGPILVADNAGADKGIKNVGSVTDLSGVAQNWDKNLPSASRFTVLTAFGIAAAARPAGRIEQPMRSISAGPFSVMPHTT